METRQMTPFFSSTFSALTVTFISEFENTQNSFSCGSPFDKFWSIKYLNFMPEATDSDSSSYFSRKQTSEVTKNQCYVLSPDREPKKGISAWTKAADSTDSKQWRNKKNDTFPSNSFD